MTTRLLPLLAFIGLAVLLFVGVRMNSGKDNSAIPSPLIGKTAPQFSLPVLNQSEKKVDTEQLKGQAYLLNVWGSWCPACQIEHPIISELAKSGKVRVIGYNYKDETVAANQWLQQFGNPYELILFDESGRTALDWGIYGAPETFLVDAEGIVRWKHVGPISPEIIEQEILPQLEVKQ
jgi:cytochrome c biogenesis protein CcmG, thiol:disulfide interchange protein DsbE